MLGSPACALSSSASSNVRFSTLAIDCVNWLAASDETRVKRGSPRSTTAMLVRPELTCTTPIASPGVSDSSASQLGVEPSSARTRANAVTSTWPSRRPAPSTAETMLAIMSRCAATSSDFHHVLVGRRHVVPDDLEVDDRFLDRNRDVVLRLVLDRAREFGALHVGQVDEAHDDLLVRDADRHGLVAHPASAPEVLDRDRDGLGVDDLALDDCAKWHGDETVRGQGVAGPGGLDLSGANEVGPDVQTDRR